MSGMEEDCIGSHGPQRAVMLKEKKEKENEEEEKKCYFVHMEFSGIEPKASEKRSWPVIKPKQQ